MERDSRLVLLRLLLEPPGQRYTPHNAYEPGSFHQPPVSSLKNLSMA
jgi:hypothetical protein